VYRRLFQDCVIALRILQAQVQVDADRIGVSGMSQGGGISLWLGAWVPFVKAVCADMPFMSGIGHTVLNYAYRYPLKEMQDFIDSIPVGEARVLNSMSYFDTSYQAEHCKVPTHMSVGLKDPSCRPPNVQLAYDALTAEKKLVELDWGHDWHSDMISNNRNWFLSKM
jgi:cephalosporin-C deacetylase